MDMEAVRPCGECTLCCKLIGICKRDDGSFADFPFDKPAGTSCKHCHPGHGCEIFGTAQFPNVCKTYLCLWKTLHSLPESFRPDKVNAICHWDQIMGHTVVRVIVEKDKPVSEIFSYWVDRCVDELGITFLLQCEDRIFRVLSKSPELAMELR
jgi:uncharacterized protein